MSIRDGSRVSLHYTLKVEDEVVDTSKGRDPLGYTQGRGEIIPGLEEQLEGLEAGDKKDVTVAPERGYGMPDPAAVREIPRSVFADGGSGVNAGDRVSGRMQGRPFEATVATTTPDTVTLDLNHPLAGKTLQFEVEIVDVR
jgi:FKBP-type peptidyl-prolyl cis-trans isomerase SlyD